MFSLGITVDSFLTIFVTEFPGDTTSCETRGGIAVEKGGTIELVVVILDICDLIPVGFSKSICESYYEIS